MRALLSLIVTLAVIAAAAAAESPVFDCKAKASKDSSLLDKVQNAYASVKSLHAKFVQHSFLSSLDSSELSSGQVWFSKPGLMKWHYAEPDVQDFIVRNETVWLYQETDNQVLIDNFKNILLTDLPVSFLMGLGDLKRDFKLQNSCKTDDGLVLELSPAAKKGELEAFKLLVDERSYQPKGAMVVDLAGNKTAIVMSELELNPDLLQDTFATNFKSGIDIVDRRKEQQNG